MKEKREILPLINERIRADKLQLITHEGTNVGVVSKREALHLADLAELDLVLISDAGQEGVPVAKIMDFGKSLYEKKKKQHESKKHQKVIQVKEVKFSPKIGENDYETKMNQVVKFLEDGKRVKITLFFRGRERLMQQEQGSALFARVDDTFERHGLTKLLVREADSKSGSLWSRVYYLKSAK